ncbi:Uncharacterised protein [Mycobacteroides abscessus subsp. massiliense]|nr:Uncharacterised protein [Mycobacteroides abscessus subsp. massiliense]
MKRIIARALRRLANHSSPARCAGSRIISTHRAAGPSMSNMHVARPGETLVTSSGSVCKHLGTRFPDGQSALGGSAHSHVRFRRSSTSRRREQSRTSDSDSRLPGDRYA